MTDLIADACEFAQPAEHKRHRRNSPGWLALLLIALLLLAACDPGPPPTMGLSIVGYNHTTDRSIYAFTVNGHYAAGMGPEGGGGGFTCCVPLPREWKPGMTVRVYWRYQGGTELPPAPPPHEAEVQVPQYDGQNVSRFAVHFYPDHKVKVLVTRMSIRHDDYPAELKWDAPTPADAAVGVPGPEEPPVINIEALLPPLVRPAASEPTAAPSTSR